MLTPDEKKKLACASLLPPPGEDVVREWAQTVAILCMENQELRKELEDHERASRSGMYNKVCKHLARYREECATYKALLREAEKGENGLCFWCREDVETGNHLLKCREHCVEPH